MKTGYVYLLASRKAGTLYVGVTSNLVQRVEQHRNELGKGFTKRYRVHRLVYYEICDDMRQAIVREKQLKNWQRAWKIGLIEKSNPGWRDLYPDILG
ncbi:MAG: GIY-YIG nuclease family protein [Candidatus Zixiibacteriota bacterium]|nr:MAG: GIY-YIG nuclease family protein [candidate division Zixibacteria bacterium]